MSEKNYDPRMHTAEHLFNGTMNKTFKCGRAFSGHVEKKKTKLDYHFDRNLSEVEIEGIEKLVNSTLALNLPVKESFMPRDEAAKLFDLSRLPSDAGENLRIISIGDYDHCPCIGPHVENTSECGKIKIISSDWEDGRLRIRFKFAE